jgi:hypothetical protein
MFPYSRIRAPDDEQRQEVFNDEWTGKPFVTLSCLICHQQIARKAYGDAIWVHLTDAYTQKDGYIEVNVSSHAPVPDVIDATAVEGN